MKLILSLTLILSLSVVSLAQDQQKDQPKEEPKPQEQPQPQPPPKKKSLSLDMNDVKPADVEDKPVEKPKSDTDKKEGDKSETKKDEATIALEEAEAALLAHKSFIATVGGQTLSTFINHMNATLKDDQKFLLREKPLKQFIDMQGLLKQCRSLWLDYFTAWGKEITADVNKNYREQEQLLNYMKQCENTINYNVSLSEEIIKQYKKKNGIK